MRESTKYYLYSALISIAIISATIGIMQRIYPDNTVVISTEGMSAEQVELLERWME